MQRFEQSSNGHRRVDPPLDRLTEREQQVLVLVAQGLAVKQVAQALAVSPKCIDTHKYRIMRKLDIHDRVDLCRYAIRQGLIEP